MSDLKVLWLPLAVTGLSLALLALETLRSPSKTEGRSPLGPLTALGLGVIFALSFAIPSAGEAAHGAYAASAWSLFLQRLFLVAGALAALGGAGDVAATTPRRQGEHWVLLTLSLAGMVFLAGARDLVLWLVSFELMSVPLYVLAAWAKTDAAEGASRGRPAEAGAKLYFVGATSTAFALFGLALFTGITGTTKLAELGATPLQPLSALGLLFVLGALGYKVGAAPFHLWVPDTYQGSRAPFVAFLSVAPKAAGVAALASLFLSGMHAHPRLWGAPVAGLALLSMGVGNVFALPQTDARRLLGYSGVAQLGYALAALAGGQTFGLATVLFFLGSYLVTNLGMFFVLHAVSGGRERFELASLAGLWKRNPSLALALACFLLSLAGIPFLVGFWAKLFVLVAAWRAGWHGLVFAGVLFGVLGLFYYLSVLRQAYMSDPETEEPVAVSPSSAAVIAACTAMVLASGLYPRPLWDAALRASEALLGG